MTKESPSETGGVEAQLSEISSNFDGVLAVAAVEPKSATRVQSSADVQLPSASVIKVLVMCEVLERLLSTGADYATPVSICVDDRVGGSGVLKLAPSVSELPVDEMLRLMIAVSDNTATNALIRWLGGPDEVNMLGASYGLHRTVIHDYISPRMRRDAPESFAVSTANELCKLFEVIMGLEGQPKAWWPAARALLSEQQYRDLVPRYWDLDTAADLFPGVEAPPVSVCSKTGFLPGLRAEAGAVLVGGESRLVYAVVAASAKERDMGVEAAPAVACGLVGRALAEAWLGDVNGIAPQRRPYCESARA